ncbi:unnamed protein product [Brassica oleracea]
MHHRRCRSFVVCVRRDVYVTWRGIHNVILFVHLQIRKEGIFFEVINPSSCLDGCDISFPELLSIHLRYWLR